VALGVDANPVVQAYYAAAEFVSVRSSNVRAVAYTADFSYLWVRTASGRAYLYEQVPEGIYRGFLSAPSKGKYYFRVVRNDGRDDVYPVRRVA
jgi:hypothetical protein